MTDPLWPPAIAAIAASGRVDSADVLTLRREVYGNGAVSAAEAGWIVALDEHLASTCPEWTAFFVEALTDHVVHQQQPSGYVSPENADWLIAAFDRDGVVRSSSELEVLVKVLETATSAPPALSAYALRQVAAAVIDGSGPLARGGRLEPGVIGRAEVDLVRRILFAFGGQGAVGITREEAEVLFELNDRSSEADNDPSWSDLFVKAIAHFLMAARGYTVQSRDEAIRREAWLDAPTGGVSALFGDMMATMLTGGLKGIWSAWRDAPDPYTARNQALEADMRVAESVTSDEVKWLADRIGRDGVIHANERALLHFLKEESPDIHPSLRTLLDTAA